VVTFSACNPGSRGFETRQGSTNLCDKMRPDSVWVTDSPCAVLSKPLMSNCLQGKATGNHLCSPHSLVQASEVGRLKTPRTCPRTEHLSSSMDTAMTQRWDLDSSAQ